MTAFKIRGKLKHYKGENGCVEYHPPPKLEALRGQFLCFMNRPAVPTPANAAGPSEDGAAAREGPSPPLGVREGEGPPGGEAVRAAPDRGGDLGANGGEPGPCAFPPRSNARRKARAYFKLAELDPAAPPIGVGDALTFVLVTKRVDQDGGQDRLARYVRPVGWESAAPPLPAPGPAPPLRQNQRGGRGQGGVYYPGPFPQFPQGGDPGYGGGYYQGVDGYGGQYYAAEQGYVGAEGWVEGPQQPGVDWRTQPPQGRAAARNYAPAAIANGDSPHQVWPSGLSSPSHLKRRCLNILF